MAPPLSRQLDHPCNTVTMTYRRLLLLPLVTTLLAVAPGTAGFTDVATFVLH